MIYKYNPKTGNIEPQTTGYAFNPFTNEVSRFNHGTGLTTRTSDFIAATGITDDTIIQALNTMDLALISNGLDSKFQVLYPMVGGTSITCSYNFMNPATFQITWGGGLTFSATGVLPNGVNGFGDTGFNILNDLPSVFDAHSSFYSRTNGDSAGCEIAADDGVNYYFQYLKAFGSSYFAPASLAYITLTPTNQDDYFIMCRYSDVGALSDVKVFKDSVDIVGGLSGGFGSFPPNTNVELFRRSAGVGQYSIRECAFASIGQSFSPAEAATLTTIVNDFQTALSRNV